MEDAVQNKALFSVARAACLDHCHVVRVFADNRSPGKASRSFVKSEDYKNRQQRQGLLWMLPSLVLPPVHALASQSVLWAKQGRGQPFFFL